MAEESNSFRGFQIEPKIFLSYILRYWFLIVLGVAMGALYAYYQVRYTQATYKTSSRMLVKDEYSSWGQEYFLPGMELVSSRNRLVNELGIIKSYPLMHRIAKALNWNVSYYKIGNIKTTEMYPYSEFTVKLISESFSEGSFYIKFKSQKSFLISPNQEGLELSKLYNIGDVLEFDSFKFKIEEISKGINLDYEYSIKFNTADKWARYFQNTLNISVEGQESSILILSEENRNPEKSIDFLNVLMKEYIEWGVEQNNQTATSTIAFVDQQLRAIADSLIFTEHQLEQFYKENFSNRIFITEDVSTNNMQRVLELEDNLTEKSIQRQYYESLIKSLKSDNFTAFPSSAVFGFDDNNVDDLIKSILDINNYIWERSFQLKEGSQPMELIKLELEEQKKSLIHTANTNKIQVERLIDSLKNIIEIEELKVLQLPSEQRRFFNLKRENKLLSDLYTYLLNKRSEASIAKASNLPKAQVLDFADLHRVSYIGPKPASIYVSSIFIGVLLPTFVILLIYLLNNKILNYSDLSKITQIPIIGTVSFKKSIDSNLVVSSNLKSIVAESYRSIRTNLNFMTEGKEKMSILVTSSISGEGKTFTSINLAAIFAASEKRTILVGADLRKPKIFQDFNLENKVGLSSVLINKASLNEAIQKTSVNHLDLIASGPIPPNPAELIESKKMDEVMQFLHKDYDIVIIDSPPLGLVTDALLLKKYADAGIYIVRHNYTKQAHLQNVNQLYKDGVLTKIGIVVNAVQQNSGIGYGKNYGYGYGYGYGSGYGYGYYSHDD